MENLLLIIYFFKFAALLIILIMKYRLFSLLFLFQLLSLNAIGQESTDTLVGHSLGGGMAAANACKTGRDAMTFNAAWVSPKTISNRHGAIIDAYIIDGDELDIVQRKFLKERANGNIHIIGKLGLFDHGIGNFYSDEDLYELKIKNAQWQYIINRPNLPFTTY